MTEKLMTISQLAALFHINQHTIRHYEYKGLVMPAEISDKGYRKYGLSEGYQLAFILFLKELGLSLGEIKQVITDGDSDDYERLLVQKKKDVLEEQARLAQLTELIDQQLCLVKQMAVPNYSVSEKLNLKLIKRLPINQQLDLTTLKELGIGRDALMGTIYYLIHETYLDMCLVTEKIGAYQIEKGNYSVTLVKGESQAEVDSKLEELLTQYDLPLIVIEDGSRFLGSDAKIVLKVLGERDV